MAKKTDKPTFYCTDCGAEQSRWAGQCSACGAWNTLKEWTSPAFSSTTGSTKAGKVGGYAGANSGVIRLAEVSLAETPRWSVGLGEFDRVLGGGLVPGSVVLIGGDPGIGKSSILLQVQTYLSQTGLKTLYVSGEESLQQIALRARRMQLPADDLVLLAETDMDSILTQAQQLQPQVLVVDSIQTMQLDSISSAAGSVVQVRETAAVLTRYAKQTGVAVFLVGHVTKSGEVAGPRVLEHIVDAVIFIEGQDSRYRLMRALKNRFGAVNEIGFFAMTDKGMKEVKNPSAIFLNRDRQQPTAGAVVLGLWEGSRPLLVEIQALVDHNAFGAPRRVAVGLDGNRLTMLLAVLHRHGGVQAGDQDVYVNVVGGVKVSETSADLPLLLAIVSSLKNRPLPNDLLVFGEIGLSGEIRPVTNGQERLQEAVKHGFTKAIVPLGNAPKTPIEGLTIVSVGSVSDALQSWQDW
jgi:DNA repair protein RadA/Sms